MQLSRRFPLLSATCAAPLLAVSIARADVRDFQATIHAPSGADQTGLYRIYVPPAIDAPRVRGVIFLAPGSGGDWRFRVSEASSQEAARALGFALIGSQSATGYISTTETSARASLAAVLAAAAQATGRLELVNAPIVGTGFSLGAFVSTEWARHVPERTLAVVAHRGGAALTGGANLAESRKVHTLLIAGSIDGNTATSPAQMAGWFPTFRSPANSAGHAAYTIDWGVGHDSFGNQGWPMAWTWIAESIALRYPAGDLPSLDPSHPLPLQTVPVSDGWFGRRINENTVSSTDYSAFPAVAPASSYSAGDPGVASWLPNETVARVYRAFTAYDGTSGRALPTQGPLSIVGAAAPSEEIQPGQTNPPQLAVLPLGSVIDLDVATRGFGEPAPLALAAASRVANGDFAQWTSGRPDGWSAANTNGLNQGPDLGASGASAVLTNTANLRQTFAPLATDFQLRFTLTINLTPGNTAWNQPLVLNLYQANQTANPTSPWLTFQFNASNVSAGPFYINAFDTNSTSRRLPGPAIAGSTYDFANARYTGTPVKYDFILNYSKATNTYSVTYGPQGGTQNATGAIAHFRNPTNAVFEGLNSVYFYSYVNGCTLDDVRVSEIESAPAPVASMAYYDGDRLLGVQTQPGPSGWRLAHALDTPGVRSLSVVGTDWAGRQSSAFRTIVVARPPRTGAMFYRFERSPGLATDHYDTLNLARGATVGSGPTQFALPESGPGSAFPRRFDFEFGENLHASRYVSANYEWLNHADHAELPSGATPFTIEAFVHLASGGEGGQFRTIAAHGSGSNLGWQFIVTGEGSGLGPRRLVLQFRADDNGGASAGTLDTINSNLEILPGVDYYVAVSLDPADTSANGIRFHLKNLTDRGSLQTAARGHTRTTVWNSTATFAVGAGWDGLLDEVRLTRRMLSPSELLIGQAVPPPPSGLSSTPGPQPGQTLLTWAPAPFADSYVVERSTSPDMGFAFVAEASATTWTDAGLDPSQTYYYRIRSANGDLRSDATATISAAPGRPSTYAGWRSLHFGDDENTVADPLADPDGDGLPNLLEYALGGDPRSPSTHAIPTAGTTAVAGANYLTITFTINPDATDLDYAVESSSDLSVWNSDGLVTLSDSGAQRVVRDNQPLGATPRFLRLNLGNAASINAASP